VCLVFWRTGALRDAAVVPRPLQPRCDRRLAGDGGGAGLHRVHSVPASFADGGGRPTAAACASLVWVAIVRRRWPSARSVVTGSRRQPYISVSFLFAHIVVCSTTLCAGPRDTRCATSGRFGSPAPARPTRLSGRHTTPRAPSLARHPVTAPLVPLGKRRAASRRSPVSSRRLSAVHNSGIARGHGHAVGATIAMWRSTSRPRPSQTSRAIVSRRPVLAERQARS